MNNCSYEIFFIKVFELFLKTSLQARGRLRANSKAAAKTGIFWKDL
jgi:hypothetical protein